MRFSLNLTGFQLVNYLARNADYIIIGRYLGAQDLGYYSLSYRLLLFPLQNISGVVGRVMFPFYARLQDSDNQMALAWLKVAGAISLIAFPLMLGVMGVSRPFVITVFGEQWMPIVPLILLLAPVGMVQSVGSTVGALYMAKGRTDWMFRWGIFAASVAVVSFLIGVRWGIIGVAAAYAIATFGLAYHSFAIPFKLIELRVYALLKVIWQPLVGSLLMLLVVLGVGRVLPTELASVWELSILVPLGVVAYGVVSWLINRQNVIEIWSLVRKA